MSVYFYCLSFVTREFHLGCLGILTETIYAVTSFIWLCYRLYVYPRYLSPLRTIPGPPLGSLISGQFTYILREEAGIPQREWVKKHGPAVRVVGPVGVERVIFVSEEALHKILVSDWTDYPRVRPSP